ncbi:MAG: leucyl aminopeptidase [Aquificaceae bacterium]|nr:MAG: leucyl aminopeptidase [Aquificaceae bacterium]
MNYTLLTSTSPVDIESDCIIVSIFEDNKLSTAAQKIDDASNNIISKFLNLSDFSGECGQFHMLYPETGMKCSRILLIGCGKENKFSQETVCSVMKTASKEVTKTSSTSVTVFLLDTLSERIICEQAMRQAILTYADTLYEFNKYKSDKKESHLEHVCIAFTTEPPCDVETILEQGKGIAKGMHLSRDLANQPSNVCTPTFIAETAESLGRQYDRITVEVLEESDMEALGMGSFLSVSKGSEEAGKMVVLQYKGSDESSRPIALVGKGVTFDTGGISLKPGASMDEMKFDMCGAASVMGTINACAEMELPINVVAVLAAAENMPSSKASKPGDIVTSMSGKTIEILNTDAEGRLVLCDALTYVGRYNPEVVIDTATLTGACIVALGHQICAVLSNDDGLAKEIMDAGKEINDAAWQLPMSEAYRKQLKSAFADIGNIGGRSAGTITAACFLSEFTKDYTWAHIDIAGTAWTGKDATGRPVPLLSQYLINKSLHIKNS